MPYPRPSRGPAGRAMQGDRKGAVRFLACAGLWAAGRTPGRGLDMRKLLVFPIFEAEPSFGSL